jgi:hypothetical protein
MVCPKFSPFNLYIHVKEMTIHHNIETYMLESSQISISICSGPIKLTRCQKKQKKQKKKGTWRHLI